MIVPILIAAAALLLFKSAPGADSGGETWHARVTEFLRHVTLVGTGTEGLYNTQQIPNTTPALTHVANAIGQGQTVYTTTGAERVYLSSDGQPPKVGTWVLYARPGLVRR